MKFDGRQKTALQKAIKHWYKDVIIWLEGGYGIKSRSYGGVYYLDWCTGEEVKLGSKYCDLCKAFIEKDCLACPLLLIGDKCSKSTSVYQKFLDNPNLRTAMKMVTTMEGLLK